MSRKARLPQSRHHILMYDEDWELLSQFFAPDGPHPIGPGAAIRETIHVSCQRLRQRIADRQEQLAQQDAAAALREGAAEGPASGQGDPT